MPVYLRNLIFVCMCFSGSWVCAQSSSSGAEQRRLADGLYAREFHDLALIEYQKLIQAEPAPKELDVIYYRAGESAGRTGQAELSLVYFKKAMEAGGQSIASQRSRYRLADAVYRKGETAEAESLLRELVGQEIDRSIDAPVRFTLAQILETSKPSEARALYDSLIRDYPKNPLSSYAALRIAALFEGGIDAKRSAYEKALVNPPSRDFEIEVLWSLAALEVSSKNVEAAADLYWKLWVTFPDSARVRGGMIHLAWAQLQAGNYEKALTLSSNTSETRKVSDGDTWLYLNGMSYLNLDKKEESSESFQSLLDTYPKSRFRGIAVYELASTYAERGEHEKVVAFASDLQQVPGREIDGLWMLAESSRGAGDTRQAIELYTRIVHQYPKHERAADSLYFRALLLVESGQENVAAEALADFHRRYPLDPRSLDALEQSGNLLVQAGEVKAGLAKWDTVLSIEPSKELLLKVALVEIRLESFDFAQKHLLAFLELKPEGAPLATGNYWLGVLFDQQAEPKQAQAYLESALEGELKDQWLVPARMRLGKSYYREKNSKKALETFLPLLGSISGKNLSDTLLLWLLSVAEETDQGHAIDQIATEMIKEYRKNVINELGQYALATQLEKMDKLQESINAWRSGIAFQSKSVDSVVAHLKLADLLLKTKDFDAAIKNYEEATRLASVLEEAHLQILGMMGSGKVRYAQAEWNGAAKHFMSIAVLFDDSELSPEALVRAADAFEKAGEASKAKQTIDELQKRYPDFQKSETP